MRFSPVSIELNNKTTSQHFHDLRRRYKQKMRSEETLVSENLDTELQSSPKLNCSVPFPLLSTDTPPQIPIEQPSFVESPSSNEPTMKVTFKQRLHGKRHVKPNRAQHAPETKLIDQPYKLTVKAAVRQYLHILKHHVKKMCPESGNTVELQTSSSIPGCKLKQVRALLPRLVQCPEQVPETGHISCVEPSRPKFSFELDESDELDEGISFVWPQRLPEQPDPTCGLKRVPTPHPLAPTDTPPQSPHLEYISLAELQEPPTESICGLDLLPPSFPRPAIDTPPASPKLDTRIKAVSFAELPCPDKSHGLKRVPTPFPKEPIDSPFQSPVLENKRTTTISFAELPHSTKICELKRVPTPFPLSPAIDTLPQKPVDNIDNDNFTVDTRRFAWYGPPDFFPNARRYKVAYPTETRQYVRPMDFLQKGRSVVGVG